MMVKKMAVFLLCFLLTFQCSTVSMAASANSAGENAKASKARNGVVRILAFDENGGGTGSGFGVGRTGEATDIFVTNWHVVSDGHGGILSNVYILLGNDAVLKDGSGGLVLNNKEQMVRCEVLGNPVQYPDFAVLRAERVVTERAALPLLSVENIEPLEPVFALGYPGTADSLNGDQYCYADIDGVNATSGTVTRIEDLAGCDNTKHIIHSCEINGGNSGGPLVTSDGAVIGINTYWIEVASSNDERMKSSFNSSVVIDYVMDELDALGISYDVFDPNQQQPLPGWVIPAAGAGAAVILVIVVLAVQMQKKKKEHEAVQARHMAEQMEKIGAAVNQVQKQAQAARQEAHDAKEQARNAQKRPQVPPQRPAGVTTPVRVQGADSGFRLQCMSGTFAGRRLVIGERMRIGRDGANNELIYPETTKGISKKHCELIVQNGKLYLRDLGSSYGTFYKNQKLKQGQAVQLQVGDTFCLAHEQERFRIDLSSGKRS